MSRELTLESKTQPNKTPAIGGLMMTPKLDENYWSYRVVLSESQAIVGFPKFFTVGVGFAVEADDWNTNLPWTCAAEEIYRHIEVNKGDDAISAEDCVTAIRLIQDAVRRDQADGAA